MGYSELIAILERLPPERRAEVFDFAEFLADRAGVGQAGATPSVRPLAEFKNKPIPVLEPFTTWCREDLYDRSGLR